MFVFGVSQLRKNSGKELFVNVLIVVNAINGVKELFA